MKLLLVSDIHLSSRPDDEFMWDLFPQVGKIIEDEKIEQVICLGDITEAKSGHSAELVNRIVDGFMEWTRLLKHHNPYFDVDRDDVLRILLGNHDLTGGDCRPFFEFMDHCPGVRFITDIWTPVRAYGDLPVAFLPHTRDPINDWKSLDLTGKLVFAHVTVNDCIAENMMKLSSSVEASFFDPSLVTYAGDIHKSQRLGKLTYIGSPYCTKFGAHNKDFEGRVIIIDTEELKTDPFASEERLLDFPLRLTFDVVDQTDFLHQIDSWIDQRADLPDAQVKLRLHLNESNMGQWREIKADLQKTCADLQWQLCDLALVKDHLDTSKVTVPVSRGKRLDFDTYCNINQINGPLREYGAKVVELVK